MARTRAQAKAQRNLPPPRVQDQDQHAPEIDDSLQVQAPTKLTGLDCAHPPSHHEPLPISTALRRGSKRKAPAQGTKPEPRPDRLLKRQRVETEAAQGSNRIGFWAKEGRWPPEMQDRPEETSETSELALMTNRKRLSSATTTTPSTPSDQKSRKEKTASYENKLYPLLLQTKGSYMSESPLGITNESKDLCNKLLVSEQPIPKASNFDDDIFEGVCENLQDKNESRVLRDISQLIVPSVEVFAQRDHRLKAAAESVNEGWNNSMPFVGPRPQPDYSVGFRREAFTDIQLTKLSPFIGDFLHGDCSFFMATAYMYFPFLTCEVKCSTAAINIADRQNTHSMTVAVRGIVELFRLLKRESELNRQILAFSISHDHTSVHIYGHYPVIDTSGKDYNVKYYRHPIDKFSFTIRQGREKWTAYQFTKNVYDLWMPAHLKKISSAIDQLPAGLDFGVPAFGQQATDDGTLMAADAGSANSLPAESDQQAIDASDPEVSVLSASRSTKRRKGSSSAVV